MGFLACLVALVLSWAICPLLSPLVLLISLAYLVCKLIMAPAHYLDESERRNAAMTSEDCSNKDNPWLYSD